MIFFKKIFWYFVFFSGLNFIYNLFSGQKLILIGYHSVSSRSDNRRKNYQTLSISENNFKKQIKYLKKNFNIINLTDIINGKKAGAVIFFDDGFEDVFINALPILRENDLKATVFLTTDLIDQKDILWTIKLRYLKGNSQETENLIEQFKSMPIIEREDKLKFIFSECPINLPKIFMDWEQVHESGDIFEYGSHGQSHRDFIEMNEDELLAELSNSKIKIEEKIKKPVKIISYPHGKYSKNVIYLVKKAGYCLGVGANRGFSEDIDLLELRRIVPETNDNLIFFKLKLGIYYPLKNVLDKIL